jgi:TatD DNase family protein
MELVDTHCHLDHNFFDEDREEVIERAHKAGVSRIVVPGLDIATSRAAIKLAEQYESIYAAVGFHPNDIGPNPGPPEPALKEIWQMSKHPKVVAIGEIGLDYHWDKTPHTLQWKWLKLQLKLAAERSLPVILHNRNSTADILAILEEWRATLEGNSLAKRPGVLHSFSGTWIDAEEALALNFYIGITGPVTFKKSIETKTVAARLPEDRLLLETDSPYLTPEPYRGKRNEPGYLRYIAEEIAALREESPKTTAENTTRNAAALFELDR